MSGARRATSFFTGLIDKAPVLIIVIQVEAGIRKSHEFFLKNLRFLILKNSDVIFQAVFQEGFRVGPERNLGQKVLFLVSTEGPVIRIYALHYVSCFDLPGDLLNQPLVK